MPMRYYMLPVTLDDTIIDYAMPFHHMPMLLLMRLIDITRLHFHCITTLICHFSYAFIFIFDFAC